MRGCGRVGLGGHGSRSPRLPRGCRAPLADGAVTDALCQAMCPFRRRRGARVPASFAVALTIAGAAPCARGQRRRVVVTEASYTAPAIRVPYVDRPLTTTRLHLSLYFGLGFEYADYYRNYAPTGRSVWGLGAHFDAAFGA